MKIFYVLRGVVRGLQSKDDYVLFFNWFYPEYFAPMVEGTLNAFFEDDDVTIVILKFLAELVYSRNNRFKFDTWAVEPLIVFRETAKYITQLLNVFDCLKAKIVK